MDFGLGTSGEVPAAIRSAAKRLQTVDRPRSSSPDFLTDPEREVLHATDASEHDILDTGTDRIVFAYGDDVVKVARPAEGPYDGLKANRLAVEQYNRASPEQRAHMAPLRRHADDMTWIVQERARRVRGYEHELEDGFEQRLGEAGIDFDDDLRWNVGYVPSAGRDVLIDYGNRVLER